MSAKSGNHIQMGGKNSGPPVGPLMPGVGKGRTALGYRSPWDYCWEPQTYVFSSAIVEQSVRLPEK